MTLINYSINTLKHGTIGVLGGSLNHFLKKPVAQFCSTNDSIFCLKPDRFFDPENLNTLSSAILTVTKTIQKLVLPPMPSLPLSANNCHRLLKLDSNEPTTRDLVGVCCSSRIQRRFNTQTFLSGAITEEFTDRYLLQKIALPFLAKLLPKRIGKPLLAPSARILITSLFFATTHYKKHKTDVTTQFMAGIIYGFLFEKFGFFAATAAHFTNNLFTGLEYKNYCQKEISKLL